MSVETTSILTHTFRLTHKKAGMRQDGIRRFLADDILAQGNILNFAPVSYYFGVMLCK